MSSENLVPISTFEDQVEEREGITIVVRAPSGTLVKPYTYDRKAAGSATVAEWIDRRLKPSLNELEVKIVDGEHESPRRSTKLLDTLRKSYN
jgi:hypothetical protein